MLTAASLPDFATDYPLAPEPIARFQQNGNVWLRGVAARNEVAAARPVILAARVRHGQEATPLDNASREKDLHRWLPGLRPGDRAASELTSLVFQR